MRQLREILGQRLEEFSSWMRHQTCWLCDGRLYDPDRDEYLPSGCGPHGVVVYPVDVETFLLGLPVLD